MDNDQKLDFEYKGTIGYRGPDNLEDVGILFAGSSLLLGTGIPYEQSIPHLVSEKLGLNHINISDFDTLTEMADDLFNFSNLNPRYIILNDFWGINDTNWLMRYWIPKEKDKKIIKEVRETFKNSNGKIFRMFELALKQRSFKVFILTKRKKKTLVHDYEPQDINQYIIHKKK